MSYQVLARKWRPRSFAQLVGQEHVVRALSHALESGRLHHAWLFTGTRGIGKTTIARILAKSLNCETGLTATPCGVCSACTEIDAGRFVDLIEVDAATNTRVDEMRTLLENAVYSPTRGRFKVYVIDEVHMLSNSAFNAMLKTLEEPPEHVKFILATTDPQKIPVTVLSRCLQFNLKKMPAAAITTHLASICAAEQVVAEEPALGAIAHAARGSMRDALSILDQAIAYCSGQVELDGVRAMLGAVDQAHLVGILERISGDDLVGAIAMAEEMQARSFSFEEALADMASLLHRVALAQVDERMAIGGDPDTTSRLRRVGATLDPGLVQVLYQIAIHGRRDLQYAPDDFAGFVMVLIRMSMFRPGGSAGGGRPGPERSAPSEGRGLEPSGRGSAPLVTGDRPRGPVQAHSSPRGDQASSREAGAAAVDPGTAGSEQRAMVEASFDGDWHGLVRRMKVSGVTRQLAERAEMVTFGPRSVELVVDARDRAVAERSFQERLRQALVQEFGQPFSLSVSIGGTTGASIAATEEAARQAQLSAAEQTINGDAFVQALISEFDATIEVVRPAGA